MDTSNLKHAFLKSKDMTLNILSRVLSSTRVEPIRDDEGTKGVKASWVGEQGESSISVNTDEWNANVKIEADEPPTLEYVQSGENRGISVKNINNITCAVDSETLDEFVSPRGAALAVCIGAVAGLIGWFIITVLRAVAVSTIEQNDTTVDAISTDDIETTEENPSEDE